MQNDQVKQLPPKKPKQSNVVAGHNEEPKAIEVSSNSVSFSLNSSSYSVIFIFTVFIRLTAQPQISAHTHHWKKLYKEWHTRRQSFLSISSKETSNSWNSAIVHFHVLVLFLVLVQNKVTSCWKFNKYPPWIVKCPGRLVN